MLSSPRETSLGTGMNDAAPFVGTLPQAERRDFSNVGYEEAMRRARDIVPVLRQRAQACEDARMLIRENEQLLHENGLFRFHQPKRFGGMELDFVAIFDVPAEIARGCPSTAWNVGNLATHHWMLGYWEPETQHEVWDANPDALIASSIALAAGRARKVDGGFVVNGRWPFSSGVESCDWNMLAGVVSSDDEADGIEYRIFLLNRSDYRINDTWNATGLCGTGSNDVWVEDAFVAEKMTVAVSELTGGPTPGSVVNPNALYALPVFSLFPYVLSGVGLGNAQACLNDYIEFARHRASTYNRAKLSDLQTTQIKIAEASAKIDAARLVMRTNCIEAMNDARRGYVPDLAGKTRLRRDGAFSVNLCTEAVSLLFAASGARSLFTSGALQRQFRDAHAVNSHLAFNFDAAGTNYGRVALDLPSENLTL